MNLHRIVFFGVCCAVVHNSAAQERAISQYDVRAVFADSAIIKISEPAYPGSTVLAIQGLLQQGKYDELNRALHRHQTEVETDILAEEDLFAAYSAFDTKDISDEPRFSAWIDSTPDNYQPYIARAYYYYGLGWASRGHNWASETEQEQFDAMTAHFEKSTKYIAASLKIDKTPMVAY